jgi:thiol-disulfide isomerase/thioredoxin
VLWASALAVVVLTIATIVAFRAGDGDGVQQVSPGDQSQLQGRDVTGETVPTETFERFDRGVLSGGRGSLGDYAGRPMVVNFFASWCTPCIKEMPAFEEVHARLGADVAFVGINTGEQVDSGQRIIQQTGITYDVLRDQTGSLTQQYEILNMPSTLFVDADGTIVRVHTGELSESELEQTTRDDLLA